MQRVDWSKARPIWFVYGWICTRCLQRLLQEQHSQRARRWRLQKRRGDWRHQRLSAVLHRPETSVSEESGCRTQQRRVLWLCPKMSRIRPSWARLLFQVRRGASLAGTNQDACPRHPGRLNNHGRFWPQHGCVPSVWARSLLHGVRLSLRGLLKEMCSASDRESLLGGRTLTSSAPTPSGAILENSFTRACSVLALIASTRTCWVR